MLTADPVRRWWRRWRCTFGFHIWAVYPDIPVGVDPGSQKSWPGIGRCLFCGKRKE